MVEVMKTFAIEFTLSLATFYKSWRPELPESVRDRLKEHPQDGLRCRILVDEVTDVEVFWQEQNLLNETVWRGGHQSEAWVAQLGGVFVERAVVMGHALRLLATRFVGRIESRELPNGAVVFDLGTV